MARSGRRPAAPRSSEPQRRRLRLSSPGLRPFLARQESLYDGVLRFAAARKAGASPIVFGLTDRHRGRGGRGLETQTGEETWLPSVRSRRSETISRARSSPSACRPKASASSRNPTPPTTKLRATVSLWAGPIMRSGALCGVMSSECWFSAGFGLAALHIIPRRKAATARRASRRGSGRSARPDEGVIGLALEEVGVDRRREGRIVELDRVILPVLLLGPAPRGPHSDIAH